MGYLARSIARIPNAGFSWYIVLLEDGWEDDLRRELGRNFENLAREIGEDALVVRGIDRAPFSMEILRAYGIRRLAAFPALLVSDVSPSAILAHPELIPSASSVVLPLQSVSRQTGSLANFLRDLTETLHDDQAIKALRDSDRTEIHRRWGWLKRLELKPNFCGFGLNLNQVIDDVLFGAT